MSLAQMHTTVCCYLAAHALARAVKLFQAPQHGRNSLLKFAHAAASATLHPSLSVRNGANLRAIARSFFMRDPSFSIHEMEMSCVQSARGFVHSSGNFILLLFWKQSSSKKVSPTIYYQFFKDFYLKMSECSYKYPHLCLKKG
jgi:hypothetical protein